jgi:hypothetical protein
MLGLGRALGETMAVTFIIGNAHGFPKSLFDSGSTIASTIANEFAEATGDLHASALMALGWCCSSSPFRAGGRAAADRAGAADGGCARTGPTGASGGPSMASSWCWPHWPPDGLAGAGADSGHAAGQWLGGIRPVFLLDQPSPGEGGCAMPSSAR